EEFEKSRRLFEESLELYRLAGDRLGAARALGNLCQALVDLGALDEADERLAECEACFRELGEENAVAAALNNRGDIRRLRGETDTALPYFIEALAINMRSGNRSYEATNRDNIGGIL